MSAKVTPVAFFERNTFLENICVRSDGSILVSSVDPKNLYYLPCPEGDQSVVPQVVHTFEASVMGIVELEHNVFYISVNDLFSQEKGSVLRRLDMNSFDPLTKTFPQPRAILTLPTRARVLNGSAVLSPNTILCADSWAALIWQIDIPPQGQGEPSARVWMEHQMFEPSKDPEKWDVPGANGLKYNSKTQTVYFTTTAQTIFGRIQIDPKTMDPVSSAPEDFATTEEHWMWADDMILDEDAGCAYVTTHRQNTIERIDLTTGARKNMAGDPTNLNLIGPTAGSWSRRPGDYGKVAYFTSDGGIKRPFDGVVREAKVVRVEFS